MKVLLLAYGSRGDVTPSIALAVALRAAGHEAVVGVPAGLRGLAGEHGVPAGSLDGTPLRLLDEAMQEWAAQERKAGWRAQLRLLEEARGCFRRVLDDAWELASSGADLVVHHPAAASGKHVAERLGVPAVVASPMPMCPPTKEFFNPLYSALPVRPRLLNRASYLPVRAGVPFDAVVNRWRTESLGLPRRRWQLDPGRRPDGGPAPVLLPVSPRLLPRPADWPANAVVTGPWFLPAPASWRPPADLVDYLESGAPPMFVGFGSGVDEHTRHVSRAVLETLRQLRIRAVVAPGTEVPDGVFALSGAVPFDWLFPRVSLVVHHGGVGTATQALAAGRPQVTCPAAIADQRFWARRLHRIGVAAPPLSRRRLTPAGLSTAIHFALGPAIVANARAVGALVRQERGLDLAVRRLERLRSATIH